MEGLQGCLHLGMLLGRAHPFTNYLAVSSHIDLEDRFVFCPGFLKQVVLNIDIPVALQEFLQTGLGIHCMVKPAHV